jgi:hypothetical protein
MAGEQEGSLKQVRNIIAPNEADKSNAEQSAARELAIKSASCRRIAASREGIHVSERQPNGVDEFQTIQAK